MKKITALLCAVLLILTACLAACSGGGDSADISGTYKLTEMSENGEDMTSFLSLLGDEGVILTINGNKATLTMLGEDTSLSVNTAERSMTAEDGTTQTYTVVDDKIEMESEGTKMVFEKQ